MNENLDGVAVYTRRVVQNLERKGVRARFELPRLDGAAPARTEVGQLLPVPNQSTLALSGVGSLLGAAEAGLLAQRGYAIDGIAADLHTTYARDMRLYGTTYELAPLQIGPDDATAKSAIWKATHASNAAWRLRGMPQETFLRDATSGNPSAGYVLMNADQTGVQRLGDRATRLVVKRTPNLAGDLAAEYVQRERAGANAAGQPTDWVRILRSVAGGTSPNLENVIGGAIAGAQHGSVTLPNISRLTLGFQALEVLTGTLGPAVFAAERLQRHSWELGGPAPTYRGIEGPAMPLRADIDLLIDFKQPAGNSDELKALCWRIAPVSIAFGLSPELRASLTADRNAGRTTAEALRTPGGQVTTVNGIASAGRHRKAVVGLTAARIVVNTLRAYRGRRDGMEKLSKEQQEDLRLAEAAGSELLTNDLAPRILLEWLREQTTANAVEAAVNTAFPYSDADLERGPTRRTGVNAGLKLMRQKRAIGGVEIFSDALRGALKRQIAAIIERGASRSLPAGVEGVNAYMRGTERALKDPKGAALWKEAEQASERAVNMAWSALNDALKHEAEAGAAERIRMARIAYDEAKFEHDGLRWIMQQMPGAMPAYGAAQQTRDLYASQIDQLREWCGDEERRLLDEHREGVPYVTHEISAQAVASYLAGAVTLDRVPASFLGAQPVVSKTPAKDLFRELLGRATEQAEALEAELSASGQLAAWALDGGADPAVPEDVHAAQMADLLIDKARDSDNLPRLDGSTTGTQIVLLVRKAHVFPLQTGDTVRVIELPQELPDDLVIAITYRLDQVVEELECWPRAAKQLKQWQPTMNLFISPVLRSVGGDVPGAPLVGDPERKSDEDGGEAGVRQRPPKGGPRTGGTVEEGSMPAAAGGGA